MERAETANVTPSESKIAELEHTLAQKDALIRELASKLAKTERRLESRTAIDKAKCLLIEAGATEEEAFARMRSLSMNTRKPLSEVAEAISRRHINSQKNAPSPFQQRGRGAFVMRFSLLRLTTIKKPQRAWRKSNATMPCRLFRQCARAPPLQRL